MTDNTLEYLYDALRVAELNEAGAKKEKEEAETIHYRQKVRVEQARESILEYLQSNGIKQDRIEGPLGNMVFTVKKGQYRAELATDLIPDEFIKIERRPKLKEIRAYLKEHHTNWGRLERGESYLAITAEAK